MMRSEITYVLQRYVALKQIDRSSWNLACKKWRPRSSRMIFKKLIWVPRSTYVDSLCCNSLEKPCNFGLDWKRMFLVWFYGKQWVMRVLKIKKKNSKGHFKGIAHSWNYFFNLQNKKKDKKGTWFQTDRPTDVQTV